MKKLLIIGIALLVSGTLLSQETKTKVAPKSFFALHGGPSFPVSDFGSTSTDNIDAGFATTGVNLNLTYGYHFKENGGLAFSFLYNKNAFENGGMEFIDETSGQTVKINLDHWQFYGISAGPLFTFNLGKNVYTDIKIMIGGVNANSPKITYEGTEMAKEDWNLAVMYQAGLDLRLDINKSVFLIAGADYLYLKPSFKPESSGLIAGESFGKFEQKISVATVTAGIGMKF